MSSPGAESAVAEEAPAGKTAPGALQETPNKLNLPVKKSHSGPNSAVFQQKIAISSERLLTSCATRIDGHAHNHAGLADSPGERRGTLAVFYGARTSAQFESACGIMPILAG
jgi:hypothetical protein